MLTEASHPSFVPWGSKRKRDSSEVNLVAAPSVALRGVDVNRVNLFPACPGGEKELDLNQVSLFAASREPNKTLS